MKPLRGGGGRIKIPVTARVLRGFEREPEKLLTNEKK